jgi:hypothetical protein
MPSFVFLGECASKPDTVPPERPSKTTSEKYLAIVLHVQKMAQ